MYRIKSTLGIKETKLILFTVNILASVFLRVVPKKLEAVCSKFLTSGLFKVSLFVYGRTD